MTERNTTIADLKDKFTKCEKEWLVEKGDTEERHNDQRNQKNKEMEDLDRKYREDLASETERHR